MKDLRFIPLLLLFALLLFNGCPHKLKSILITTGRVIENTVTDRSASVEGIVVDPGEGISAHGHCWSTSSKPTVELKSGITNLGRREKEGTFTSDLTNLANGTTYYVRAYAENGNAPTVYGDDKEFTTVSHGQPIVETSPVVTYITSATVGGKVTSDGGSTVTECGVYWGASDDPENTGTKLACGSVTSPFSLELTDLLPGTFYYVLAYAINSVDTGRGSVVSFRTPDEIDTPSVETTPVTIKTDMTATVGGEVTQSGGATVTDRGIYWGTSLDPSSTGTKLSNGSGTGSFSEELTGLSPETKYYIEAFAVNSAGTGYGDVENFTTTPPSDPQNFVYGGGGDDKAKSIIQTSDGGFAIAGVTNSIDGDITDPRGGNDFWVVKTYPNGILEWQRSFGGSGDDEAKSIIQTSDGGFAIAGMTNSIDGDITDPRGGTDFWVVKTYPNGTLEWQSSLGGSSTDWANSIIQTSDGGYVVAGISESDDHDVDDHIDNADFWVVKLNSSGGVLWKKSLGGNSYEIAESVIQSSDGGYIVGGSTQSNNNGDVSPNHGLSDYWIVKLDSNGDQILWEKTFGGTGNDRAQSIIQTSDGGYAITGESESDNDYVSGNQGYYDFWTAKLWTNGNLQWQKSYGGTDYEKAKSIVQTFDGGYAIAGYSYSNDGDLTNNEGGEDYWIIKLDDNGEKQWQMSVGGSGQDRAYSIIQAVDASYVVAGSYCSDNADFNADYKVFILK